MMAVDEMTQITQVLENLEKVAQEILTDKQLIIDMDRKRNKNREALRQLRNSTDNKTWTILAGTFFKVDTNHVREMLQKDQERLDQEINKTRDGLKVKMNILRNLEGNSEIVGYDLKPLDRDEVQAIHKIYQK